MTTELLNRLLSSIVWDAGRAAPELENDGIQASAAVLVALVRYPRTLSKIEADGGIAEAELLSMLLVSLLSMLLVSLSCFFCFAFCTSGATPKCRGSENSAAAYIVAKSIRVMSLACRFFRFGVCICGGTTPKCRGSNKASEA